VNLNLEQVPESRGPMMSFGSAMYRLGSTLGAGIGGVAILLFGYGVLGVVIGVFSLWSMLVYLLFAREPKKEC
jgi:predicted MFS family arabinose efflux permease